MASPRFLVSSPLVAADYGALVSRISDLERGPSLSTGKVRFGLDRWWILCHETKSMSRLGGAPVIPGYKCRLAYRLRCRGVPTGRGLSCSEELKVTSLEQGRRGEIKAIT